MDIGCPGINNIKQLIRYSVENDIYDSNYIQKIIGKQLREEFKFRSDKLKKLDRLLKFLENKNVILVVKEYKKVKILAEICCEKYVEQNKELIKSNNIIFTTYRYIANNNYRRRVMEGFWGEVVLVYFDFESYLFEGNRVLLLPDSDKQRFQNAIAKEEKLVEKVSSLARGNSENLAKRHRAYEMKVEKTENEVCELEDAGEGFGVENTDRKEKTNKKQALKRMVLEVDRAPESDDLSKIKAVCSSIKIKAGAKTRILLDEELELPSKVIKIYSLIQTPVRMRFTCENPRNSALDIHVLKFGHVSSPSTFSNIKMFAGSGIMHLNDGKVNIIYNTTYMKYKINVSLFKLDPFVFVYATSKNVYLTLTTKNSFKAFYFDKAGKLWKRASIKNMQFCEERFDIQVCVSLAMIGLVLEYFFRFRLTYSYLREEETGMRLKEIRNLCGNMPFEECYYLECLLSQKGRFLANCIRPPDMKKLRNMNFIEAIRCLDLIITQRFMNVSEVISNLDSGRIPEDVPGLSGMREKLNMHSDEPTSSDLVKSAVCTPLRIIYQYPSQAFMNRVLREFDIDKFIRFGFREENLVDRISKSSSHDPSEVFDHYRSLLTDGIFLGKRKFFFLAMSSSQLRMHNAWFVTPYSKNGNLVGPDFIRSWIGDFSMIKNIGKYAVRLGQVFSTTTGTLIVNSYREEEDIVRGKYVFSDGIGLIRYDLAEKVAAHMGISFVPSAFQIRFAGYKGVVSAANIEEGLVLRKSMKKFESGYNVLEVVTYAQRRPCHLNRQIIMILESLGVSRGVFIKIHDQHIFRILKKNGFQNKITSIIGHKIAEESRKDGSRSIFPPRKQNDDEEIARPLCFVGGAQNIQGIDSFQHSERGVLVSEEGSLFSDIKSKARIFVSQGMTLIGVLDEVGVLEENEIFIMSKVGTEDVIDEKINVYNDHLVVNSDVLVAKNPCLHPGDLRVIKAVDRECLHYLKECVVFSRKGKRPIFNMCSGSDLDGDIYTISWDSRIIPPSTVRSYTYESTSALYKEVVSMVDIVNFYIKYMQEDQVGLIANAHLSISDISKDGVKNRKAVILADLFNMGIDFPKTGYIATLPFDLAPQIMPDYMEPVGNRYLSTKAIGRLYRRTSYLEFPVSVFCGCEKCMCFSPEEEVEYPQSIDGYVKEGLDMVYRYEKGLITNLKTYRYTLRTNHLKALAWHKAGLHRKKHSFFQFFIEELVDIEKYRKKKECILKHVLDTLRVPYVVFFLSDCAFLVDFKYENRLKDIFSNTYKKHSMIKRKESKDSYIEARYIEVGNEVVFVSSVKKHDSLKQSIGLGPLELFKELFLILLDLGFVSYKDINSLFNFLEFLVESLKGSFTKEALVEILIKISSGFYSSENFNLSESFTNFLLFGVHSEDKKDSPALETQKRSKKSGAKDFVLEHRSNSLLAAALLISTSIKLKYKLRISKVLFRQDVFKISKKGPAPEKRVVICKFNDLVIVGMFDQYDEIYLSPYNGLRLEKHSNTLSFVPNLLNFGKASIEIYKDALRQFLVSHVLSKSTEIQARILPGVLYFCEIPPKYKNNNIRIRDFRNLISFFEDKGMLKAYFKNHIFLLEKLDKKLIKKNSLNAGSKEESFVLYLGSNTEKYKVHISSDLCIKKVSAEGLLLGSFQFIRAGIEDRKDLNIELQQEDEISLSALPESLRFITTEKVLTKEKNKLKLNAKLAAFCTITLEASTSVILESGKADFRLGFTRVFSGVDCSKCGSHGFAEAVCLFKPGEEVLHEKIESFFEEVWNRVLLLDGIEN